MMDLTRIWMRVLVLVIGLSGSIQSYGQGPFPTGPNPNHTPGVLCENANEHRYPEKIAYCRRNVSSETKRQIITDYDKDLGYKIRTMDRQDFKIDHLIPLCAGGSNSVENLWPQHRSVYEITDPMEHIGCEKLSEGLIKQKDLIDLILEGKNDLDKVPVIVESLRDL